ncbi:beta-1,6-galactanase [Phlyctema vagabunda]|uniref:Beta-1,6-galactanase n=1 Tax=Phlyctema vagabunda TaxID=108571 RepID=A0ABR4P9N2_9HELO
MYLSKAISSLIPFVALAAASPISERAAWPYAPFTTTGRWIIDAAGNNITYAGVNWPGASETMIPEGLQYSSIEDVVTKIKSIGMNVIRLTFSIELIDDYYSKGGDTTVYDSFINALGQENGTIIFDQIVANNPSITTSTTRLEVFDAIAAECAKQEIYVNLDNHISKAMWCCNTEDGNSWFGDTYFDVPNWLRGLKFMASRGAAWGNLVSMSFRNELRSPDSNSTLVDTSYNWSDWYKYVVQAMDTINAANPDVLILISGLNFDTTLAPIPTAGDLGNGQVFHKDDFSYADKLVLELHNYQTTATDCASVKSGLYNNGYKALDTENSNVTNVFPVVMTEWGHSQDDTTYASVYQTCLSEFLTDLKAGWMVWVIAGSYYIRTGTQDFEESWGLLNHNWTAWRNPAAIESVIVPMIEGTKTF